VGKGVPCNVVEISKSLRLNCLLKGREPKSLYHHHLHLSRDQVRFVKPVVAKATEVTEEPPKLEWGEKLGAETIKGDPDAVLSVAPVGNGQNNKLLKKITNLQQCWYRSKTRFPGGMDSFTDM
jgi:hypothetical protein